MYQNASAIEGQHPSKPRVGRYVRKSRDDGEGETLQETLARHMRITDLMAQDRGLTIDETYEEVVSGASISDRPEMIRLMQDLKDRKWDIIVVVDISRLSRGDGSDQAAISNAFRLTGTKCLSDYRIYDLDNSDDLELFESKLQSSRSEYKAITKRLRRGVDATIADGYSAGGLAPYGLRRVGSKRRKTFEPNDDFENLMEIFRYCHDADDPTWHGLQRHMHAMGIPSPRGNGWWAITTLRSVVDNPVYEGISRWGVHQTESYLGDDYSECKRNIINDSPKLIDARWPAFIDPEYRRVARERIGCFTPVPPRKEQVNPLAGLLRCGKCGYVMALQRSLRLGKSHFAHAWVSPDASCKCKAVKPEVLMAALASTLKRDAEALEMTLTDKGAEQQRERVRKALGRTEKDIAAARQGLLDAYDRLARGIIDEDVYVAVAEREKARIESMEGAIAEMERQLSEFDSATTEARIVGIHEMLEALEDDSLTPKQVNAILKQFIERINYYNDAPPRVHQHIIRLDVFLK